MFLWAWGFPFVATVTPVVSTQNAVIPSESWNYNVISCPLAPLLHWRPVCLQLLSAFGRWRASPVINRGGGEFLVSTADLSFVSNKAVQKQAQPQQIEQHSCQQAGTDP